MYLFFLIKNNILEIMNEIKSKLGMFFIPISPAIADNNFISPPPKEYGFLK